MMNIGKLFNLPYSIEDYRVTKIEINPESLKLEDHKFYFVYEEKYTIERKVFGFFKKTETHSKMHNNVVVTGGSSDTEIVKNFNYLKCIPGKTILDLYSYTNISGECLISESQNQDGSYDLVRLPYVKLTFTYIGDKSQYYHITNIVSFSNSDDITKLLKDLVDDNLISDELFQDKETTGLITDVYKYIKNYIRNGK